jgi:hypothetical protein
MRALYRAAAAPGPPIRYRPFGTATYSAASPIRRPPPIRQRSIRRPVSRSWRGSWAWP